MRKLTVPLLLGVLILLPITVQAQSDRYAERQAREQAYQQKMSALYAQVPPNIVSGLDQLHHDYYDEAEKQIFSSSRSPANGSLAPVFRDNREHDGEYQGYDVVSVQNITPRLRIIYLALEYEKAPYLLKFTLYRTADGWVVFAPVAALSLDSVETLTMNSRQTEPTQ